LRSNEPTCAYAAVAVLVLVMMVVVIVVVMVMMMAVRMVVIRHMRVMVVMAAFDRLAITGLNARLAVSASANPALNRPPAL